MPRSYPPEVRRQVVELARAQTTVKQLALRMATQWLPTVPAGDA
jgi:hypothetical protein